MKPSALYLHVPFCKSICAYCDFTRVGCNSRLIDQWLDTIEIEIKEKKINPNLDTIYIGGGTPTALDECQLDRLLSMLDSYCLNVLEYTVEVNPETINDNKIKILKKHGVNRLSIGLQSISSQLLKLMNRQHDFEMVKVLINKLRNAGINNLSLDCMYSLPTQTMDDLIKTLDALIELKIPHISLYSLTIEANSFFGRNGYSSLDDEIESEMYFEACNRLEKAGYKHYEISNFALSGMESKHNQVYWRYEDFYGIGLGASGKENHKRYDNTTNFNDYFNHKWTSEIIELDKKDEMFEMIMMNLRLRSGMSLKLFQERFGYSLLECYKRSVEEGINRGWLVIEDNYLLCTDEGYPILNTVLELFLDD